MPDCTTSASFNLHFHIKSRKSHSPHIHSFTLFFFAEGNDSDGMGRLIIIPLIFLLNNLNPTLEPSM